jgi:hypothetical protein
MSSELIRVDQILPAQDLIDDGDMHLRRALPQAQRTSLGAFVMDTSTRLEQA